MWAPFVVCTVHLFICWKPKKERGPFLGVDKKEASIDLLRENGCIIIELKIRKKEKRNNKNKIK